MLVYASSHFTKSNQLSLEWQSWCQSLAGLTTCVPDENFFIERLATEAHITLNCQMMMMLFKLVWPVDKVPSWLGELPGTMMKMLCRLMS